MKNLFVLLFCLPVLPFFAQKSQIDTGRIGEAAYEIRLPTQWNKALVLYAHGYETPETPLRQMNPNPVLQVFLDRGFATARTSYSRTGWALPEGVSDVEALRRLFIKKYGKPDTIFIVGHSMGGAIALSSIENNSKRYAGGLALCPLSNRPYEQIKIVFDNYVLLNALFDNPLPPLSQFLAQTPPSVSARKLGDNLKQMSELIGKIQTSKPEALNQFLEARRLKKQDLTLYLAYSQTMLLDIVAQTGGNPFDNTNTYYENYGNDWELNQKIERFTATVPSERLKTYDRSGNLDKPVVVLHTTYDQLITPHFSINPYDALVHKHKKEHNLKFMFTNGQGHCAFTPQQTATAFDALRTWVKTKQKPLGIAVP
jgi:pimeloyl-ACP methyl ester carboxylesterase